MVKLKDILNEIGEGSAKPYKWKADHKPHMVYGIKTTKYEYVWETDSGLKYVFTIDPVWMEEVPDHMGNWVASFGPFEKGDALYAFVCIEQSWFSAEYQFKLFEQSYEKNIYQ